MKIEGQAKLRRKLQAIPRVARREIEAAIQKSAAEMVVQMQNFVPVDEGILKSTIGFTFDRSLLRATIVAGGEATTRPVREGASATYDYAFAQEFGTQEMEANPFFYPAYRLGKRRAKGRITRAINKAAKQVAAGGR